MVNQFTILVYRMPPKPTAARVAVWRLLKKIGAIYLQQSICVFPNTPSLRKDLAPILRRITDASGDFHLLPLQSPDRAEREKLIEQFQEQTSNHYQEIIENCEVNFTKEIEFETFRKNFTYEEAEEKDLRLVRARPSSRLVRSTEQVKSEGMVESVRENARGLRSQSL